jgi:protein ImuB
MFGALYLVEGSAEALLEVARDAAPRFEVYGSGDLLLDLDGLTRLFGAPRALARELRRAVDARGLRAGIALAGTGTAARLLARAGATEIRSQGADVRVVEPGTDAAAVAPLPLALLATVANENDPNDLLSTFHRWGLRTLGDLAALAADEVAARLGTDGLRWHRLAEGRDLRPLRPAAAEERFEQALDLEWPIEGLEPLSFVLGRLLEPLAAHLERRGRGAAVLRLRLHLVTRAVHERSLDLPAPMREARALRTLLLLDLESHPAPAAIDRVAVAVDPTPARVLQFSLLDRPLPSPERVSTLMARLSALMGEGRCGSPAAVDAWQPGAFGTKAFEPGSPIPNPRSPIPESPAVALRRFRVPVPARVRVDDGRPVRVGTDRRGLSGGRVQACAGPWRTSGGWWNELGSGIGDQGSAKAPRSPIPSPRSPTWDRDEWDVALGDAATYRIYCDRATGAWFLDGVYD